VNVAGRVRLVADGSNGLVVVAGNVIDLSVSGCAIRVHTQLEANREARLEVELDGKRIWLPGRIVWTRTREHAWVVGIRFDQLVAEKRSHVMKLVARRQGHD
jgi:hypothetical protein